MNWKKLFEAQQELDSHIIENHQLEDNDLFSEKCLALLVELGELANETRCFKFWSTKDRSEREVILEEYVDGVHFIMSLGIEKGYTYESNKHEATNNSEVEQFNHVFSSVISFKNDPSEANYKELFQAFLQLGMLLGFNEQDVQKAYYEKNEVNFARQKENY